MNTLKNAIKNTNVAVLAQCNRYTLVRANEECGVIHYIVFDGTGRYHTDGYDLSSIQETIAEDFAECHAAAAKKKSIKPKQT